MPTDTPETVLDIVVEREDSVAHLLGVGAGFEDGAWRFEALTEDLIQWAADWILTPEEIAGFGPHNYYRLLGKALSRIYKTVDYEKRGEIGELLLHIILRRFLRSEKVISRIYFKDASNDTVKGFDAVHVVERQADDGAYLELWLGESKFYKDSVGAFTAVLDELQTHLSTNYLRHEFAAIADKIPAGFEHEQAIKALLLRTISLDQVFKRVVIPIFVTFDSPVLGRYSEETGDYIAEISAEIVDEWDKFKRKFAGSELPREVRVHLILMPMSTKKDLIDSFDGRLKDWQRALNL